MTTIETFFKVGSEMALEHLSGEMTDGTYCDSNQFGILVKTTNEEDAETFVFIPWATVGEIYRND
jgi:hypothetical protein